jgi:DNA repair and recombination protein RAD52
MLHVRRNGRTARRRLMARKATANGRGDGLPRRVLALLAQPLDPALVSEREARDGRLLQYIEGWAAIQQANRIFGHDGWGAEVVGEVSYRPIILVDSTSDAPPTAGMYTAVVRVSVRGFPPRSDVGCAFVTEETPEAHEVAYKGAVTDALKRALRHLGEQFGLGLYERRSAVDATSPKRAMSPRRNGSSPKLDSMRRKVLELSGRLGVDEQRARAWVEQRYGRALEAMAEQELADAVRSLAEQLNQRNGARRLAA